MLDELEASRSSRKRAWENLQELRWVLQDSAGMKLPPPAKKTIDLEGKLIKDGRSIYAVAETFRSVHVTENSHLVLLSIPLLISKSFWTSQSLGGFRSDRRQ